MIFANASKLLNRMFLHLANFNFLQVLRHLWLIFLVVSAPLLVFAFGQGEPQSRTLRRWLEETDRMAIFIYRPGTS